MGRRTWIKIFSEKWLRGSIRQETPQIRGIWIDLLALAADSAYGDYGLITIAPGIGFTDKQIAKMLNLPRQLWVATKGRLKKTGRILVTNKNEIQIKNWKKYQSEYARQKPQRQIVRQIVRQKVRQKVTVEKEKEKENKNNTTKSTSPLDEITNAYQKKFPEARKLWGLAGIVRAREFFDGCLDVGWTKDDILNAIEKATSSKPWEIISIDKKIQSSYSTGELQKIEKYEKVAATSEEGKKRLEGIKKKLIEKMGVEKERSPP